MARLPEDRGVQRVNGANGSTIGDKIQYNVFIFVLRSVVLLSLVLFPMFFSIYALGRKTGPT